MPFLKQFGFVACALLLLAGCGTVSVAQKESPANTYKEYKGEPRAAVLGVGEPISKRQMRANATIEIRGNQTLKQVMDRIASTYNVAVRWGNGVRPDVRENLLIADLTFEEARSYLEDVFDIQIVREGERRLLVLPAADVRRIGNFSPGINVTLSQAVRGLAQQCEMNLVITENKNKLATTAVTTSLRDVTCDDAFRALLSPHGLSLINKGDYYVIGGLPQRQWLVNLYEALREEEQEVSYASEVSGGNEEGGSSSVGGSGRVTTTVERDLWQELEDDLKDLLANSCEMQATAGSTAGGGSSASLSGAGVLPPPSLDGGSSASSDALLGGTTGQSEDIDPNDIPSSCGYVRVNRAVGMVQMRAPMYVLEQADEIVSQIEDIASRRLLVEARVLAVKRTRGFNQDGALKLAGNESGVNPGITSNIGSIVGAVNNRLRDLASNVEGTAFYASGNSLDAVVRYIEEFGTTYQLMRPTMEVMDRQRAMLIDGTNRKYFLIQTTQQTNADGTPGDTTTEVEERTQFVGLQFSVGVQVAEEGDPHTVSVQIPMTEIVETIVVPDNSNSTVPVVNTRLIDQKVRLRDGEIKAIGGLTRTLAVDTEQGVPVARGIPGVGSLFNKESVSYEDVEFVILLQVQRLY